MKNLETELRKISNFFDLKKRQNSNGKKSLICINYSNAFFFLFFQNTPMHWAAKNGHTETVKVLAEMGADLNAKDKWDEVKNC